MTAPLLCGLAPPDLPERLAALLPTSPRALARIVFSPTATEHGTAPDRERVERLALRLGAALAGNAIRLIVERQAVTALVGEIGSEARRFALTLGQEAGAMALPPPGRRKEGLIAAGQILLAAFARHYRLAAFVPDLSFKGSREEQADWRPEHEAFLVAALKGLDR